MVILNNTRLYEKEISILIVIADPGIFIRIIQSYLCIVSTYYILCISWIIKCLIIIDARCNHEV